MKESLGEFIAALIARLLSVLCEPMEITCWVSFGYHHHPRVGEYAEYGFVGHIPLRIGGYMIRKDRVAEDAKQIPRTVFQRIFDDANRRLYNGAYNDGISDVDTSREFLEEIIEVGRRKYHFTSQVPRSSNSTAA